MKIAMMTRWNASCGVSVHAEPLGRAWREMGHDLKIFALLESDSPQTNKDEPYVLRCFTFKEKKDFFFYKGPFIEEDYDIFVVQNLWTSENLSGCQALTNNRLCLLISSTEALEGTSKIL